jgi:hypothetical protein
MGRVELGGKLSWQRHLSNRQLMRSADKQRRKAISDAVRGQGIRLRCDQDGYVMRAYHTEWRGSYYRCRNGHVAPWESVMAQFIQEGVFDA